jgi:hypothetical protein
MNNISFLHFLAFHDALKDYFTTFRFSYSLVSDVQVSFVDPTCTGESNEMKRSEPVPLYTQQTLKHITIENPTNMAE